MATNKRNHTPEFKAQVALEALRGKDSVADIAARHDIHPSLVHAWRQQLKSSVTEVFLPDNQVPVRAENAQVRSLHRQIAKLEAEQQWLLRVASGLALHDKRAALEPENSAVSLLRQTKLLGLHRSGVYYHRRVDANTHTAVPMPLNSVQAG